jgi:hypothetical protein
LDVTQRQILEAGWRELDAMLAAAVPVHAARLEIEQRIVDLRTAERLDLEGKLHACQERLEIALAKDGVGS